MIDQRIEQNEEKMRLLPVALILGIWFIVNLAQAFLTNLFDDEALFWMYGERLNWGFYEHPPMAGLMIKIGYAVFHNELGVRLLFVISSTLSIFLLMKLAGVKNYLLFSALTLTTLIMQPGGFYAAPDMALVLFILLFFFVYRELLKNDTILNAVLWGVVMAAMIYSKYNGILVIFFTLISNLKILKRRSFYIAAATAILLFLPHIIWSFQHDHPTIYYHLIERSFEQYNSLEYLSCFIAGQFGVYGPFLAIFYFWFSFTFKPTNLYERSLKFSAVGIMLFFLLFSLRGQAEPNWTIPAFLPMIILTYKGLENRIKLHRLIYTLSAISLVIMLALRVYLVYDYLKLPNSLVNLSELYYSEDWAREVEQAAGDRPVLFLGSYQRASKYSFYTGKTAHSVDAFDAHRTQYYYWSDLEKGLQGKDVLVVCNEPSTFIPNKEKFISKDGKELYRGVAKNLRSTFNIALETRGEPFIFPASSSVKIPVRIYNNGTGTMRFDHDTAQPSHLVYHINQKGDFLVAKKFAADISHMVIPQQYADTLITITTPDKPGKYYFWVSIQTGWFNPGRNQNYQVMEIY